MLFARTAHAQRHLGLQFEKRYIEKTYIAHIFGHLPSESGYINLPLIADWPNRPRQKIDFEQGKNAITHWERVSIHSNPNISHVKLHPVTGRSHQLRVHMKAIGHPILGDRIYAPDTVFNLAKRLLLHAYKIQFRHPEGGDVISLSTPISF